MAANLNYKIQTNLWGGSGSGSSSSSTRRQAISDAQGWQNNQNASLGRATNATNALRNAGDSMNALGSYYTNQYKANFAPLMNQLPSMAIIPEQEYVNRAATDVSSNFARSRAINARNMSRMGVNPSSGKYADTQSQLAMAEAAARAGSMNSARRKAMEDNWNRSLGAVNMGLNVARMGTNAYGSSGSLYGSAAGQNMAIGNQYGQLAGEAGYAGTQKNYDSKLSFLSKKLDALFG